MNPSPSATAGGRSRSEAETSHDSLPADSELAEQIAERLRAEEALRLYASRLEHLQRISLAILSADSLAAVVQIAVGFVEETIDCLAAGISLYDPDRAEVAVVGSSSYYLPSGSRLPITQPEALDAVAKGHIYVFADIKPLAADSPAMRRLVEMGGRSVLGVPLRAGETLLGGMWIATAEPHTFTPEEVAIAREVCDLVAVAIQNRRLLEAEQRARQRERSLREIGASLTLGLHLDEVLQRILSQLEQLIPFASAGIVLLDGRRLAFTARGEVHVGQQQLEAVLEHTPTNLQRVYDSCKPYLIDDTRVAEDWSHLSGFEYIRSWLGVPLLLKGVCIGALTADREQPHSFTAEDEELMLAFANQAAVAIDNARLFGEVQTHAEQLEARVRERTRELEALYGITAATLEDPDLDSVLSRALQLATQAFGCPAAAVHLAPDDPAELCLANCLDNGAYGLAELLNAPAALALLNHLTSDSAPWIADDPPSDLFGERVRAVAVAPLRAHGRRLGLLSLWSATPFTFADSSLLLTTIADQLGAAVENIQLRQMTRQSAILEERERLARELHDAVTQTIFSAGLFAEAARESARSGDLAKVELHTQSIVQRVYQAQGEMRLLLFELRTDTLARRGLAGALRDRLESVEERAHIATTLLVEGVAELPVTIEEAFYRVALEALNNALRHARADRVAVTLRAADGALTLIVRDNGVGFRRREAARRGGMGLDSMEKRIQKLGGTLLITSRPNRGTRIEARAPLSVVNGGRGGRATPREGGKP